MKISTSINPPGIYRLLWTVSSKLWQTKKLRKFSTFSKMLPQKFTWFFLVALANDWTWKFWLELKNNEKHLPKSISVPKPIPVTKIHNETQLKLILFSLLFVCSDCFCFLFFFLRIFSVWFYLSVTIEWRISQHTHKCHPHSSLSYGKEQWTEFTGFSPSFFLLKGIKRI